VLELLHVHGVAVDRIVVAVPLEQLSPRAMEVLQEVEAASGIVVQLLSQRLGLDRCWGPLPDSDSADENDTAASYDEYPLIRCEELSQFNANEYWKFKRIIDVCVAALLMAFLVPILPLIAFVVTLDVGFPLIFWQQRPGLRGKPFRLYKFRTMRASHDRHFNRVPDEKRLSPVGRFLRQMRIDELPQLYNVLVGDMSLVGPRPLLLQDQSPDFAVRLSVRPGLTGWAQVNGGRVISATDKAMLDTWYVNKASFLLDLRIIFRTARMLLLGDRINAEAVSQARQDLDQNLAVLTE
jgi:lipopolysaccharide/colanic/teichoic acid biosynthesis glycosyltransferase